MRTKSWLIALIMMTAPPAGTVIAQLAPPSVPPEIAHSYYGEIKFQDEYNRWARAKQDILDALNTRCLKKYEFDAAIASAERTIDHIGAWSKYHPDEGEQAWAKFWKGNLQHYIDLLKKWWKPCKDGAGKTAPPKETPPSGQPGGTQPPKETPPEGQKEECPPPEDKTQLEIKVIEKKNEVKDLERQDEMLGQDIEDKEAAIRRMNYYLKHPDEPREGADADIDPRTEKADYEAEKRELELKRTRLKEERIKTARELGELQQKLDALNESACPDDRHASKGLLDNAPGNVSIGVGVGASHDGHHRRDKDRVRERDRDDENTDDGDDDHENVSHGSGCGRSSDRPQDHDDKSDDHHKDKGSSSPM